MSSPASHKHRTRSRAQMSAQLGMRTDTDLGLTRVRGIPECCFYWWWSREDSSRDWIFFSFKIWKHLFVFPNFIFPQVAVTLTFFGIKNNLLLPRSRHGWGLTVAPRQHRVAKVRISHWLWGLFLSLLTAICFPLQDGGDCSPTYPAKLLGRSNIETIGKVSSIVQISGDVIERQDWVAFSWLVHYSQGWCLFWWSHLCLWSSCSVASRVWLFATPWTIAHWAPLCLEFSRQEYWSGLPVPVPGDLPNLRLLSLLH